MQQIWHKEYPAGVATDVDVSQYGSLVDLLEESFSKYRNDKAYVLMDKFLTYGELDEKSAAMGAYLQSLGLERGDRVAIMLPNVLQYPVACAAILRAGFIVVNVNPLYTERELEHQLNDSGAKAIIILENFATVLQQVVARTPVKHTIVASIGEMLGFPKGAIVNFVLRNIKKAVPGYSLPGSVKFKDALAKGAGKTLQKAQLSGDDVAVLQYTGGTTGLSKGATLLHSTLIAALLASEQWLKPGLQRKPIEGQMTFICALPLYHVFAFVSCSLLATKAGGLCVLIPNPRDLDASIKEMAKYRFHIMPAVNTLFNGLAAHPEFAKLDFSQLRISNGGGMAVTKAVAERWLEITGCAICEGYGLTETSSGITCNPTNTDAFTGTVGLPMPGVHVKMVDDDGNEVPIGERGEIAIKGPQVMRDYWQQPEASEAAFTKDGFFLSGDIGIMEPNGYARIVDRKKDMIIVSGFNVFPNELEDVAGSCPGVLECACVGVPDEKSGEAIKLFVVKSDPNLSEADVRAYCTEHLTGYKKPKYIEFRDEFPKTNVGKILRRELRDEAAA
ncbi:long-chain-fatty-acid--CoA ligase [Pseudahrensia aquimaris]|uniref:Long-chain-fatty-acid--CoA ligase n=1 Tax=Pseudahrensia aquimaris TaxID=744461 RepID=A0ABW3FG57_9HYPH